jgi:hypothetical protein
MTVESLVALLVAEIVARHSPQHSRDMRLVLWCEDDRDELGAHRSGVIERLRKDSALPGHTETAPRVLDTLETATIDFRAGDDHKIGDLDLSHSPARPPLRRRTDISVQVGIDTVAPQPVA